MTPPNKEELSKLSQEQLDEMLAKDPTSTIVQAEFTRRGIDHNTGQPMKKTG